MIDFAASAYSSFESPPSFLKWEKYILIREESEKLKKGGGSVVQGQVFLKGGREAGTFPIQFFQGLSPLHLEITLPLPKLCYASVEIFFLPPSLYEKIVILYQVV